MRCTRIVATFILATSLIFCLVVTTASADSFNDTIGVYTGIAHYYTSNNGQGVEPLWVQYEPTVSGSNKDIFTFSSLPYTITENGFDFSFDFFVITMFQDNTDVVFERGYIYKYNFEIRSTKVINPENTYFEFGVCEEGYYNALPLSNVIYTYDKSGSTVNYHVSVTVNVDDSFPLSSMPDPEEALIYLRINSVWSGDMTFRASELVVEKAVGEEAYYQASLDAIENLPNTEYDFILNKMPNSEGEIQVIQGDILDILQAYDPGIQQLVQIMRIDQAKPCVYLPQVSIPIVDIDVFNNQVFFVDDYLNTMNPAILSKLDVVLIFIRLVFCVTFATFTVYKLARIEWWY